VGLQPNFHRVPARFTALGFYKGRGLSTAQIRSKGASPDAEANVLNQQLHIHTCRPGLLYLISGFPLKCRGLLVVLPTSVRPSVGVQASSFPFACLSPGTLITCKEWKIISNNSSVSERGPRIRNSRRALVARTPERAIEARSLFGD
jgi:hypothetical protein